MSLKAPGNIGLRPCSNCGAELVVFSIVGPLMEKVDVKLNGIKAGSLLELNIDPVTFLDEVNIEIDDRITLPPNTMTVISAEGAVSGQYLRLKPREKKEMPLQEEVSQTPSTVLI